MTIYNKLQVFYSNGSQDYCYEVNWEFLHIIEALYIREFAGGQ